MSLYIYNPILRNNAMRQKKFMTLFPLDLLLFDAHPIQCKKNGKPKQPYYYCLTFFNNHIHRSILPGRVKLSKP